MKQKTIGLTGGIATGKSYVAQVLSRTFQAWVLDCDWIARYVVRPETDAWREIVKWFGEKVLLPDKHLNRQKIAEIIFHDTRARKKLEAIIHPRVIQAVQETVNIFRNTNHWLLIIMAPLLIETRMHTHYCLTVVTHCPPEVQIARLMKRDGLKREEAEARLSAQLPPSQKLQSADVVIDTSGTYEETFGQILALIHRLDPDHPYFTQHNMKNPV